MLLETTQLVYYKILFVIWQTIIYYADLLDFETPCDLFDMYNEIIHIGNWSIIHIELCADMEEGKYNTDEIQEILREYMTIVLLPESEIPPYSNGDEIVESVHLHSVRHDAEKGNLNLDFLYINNSASYQLYKEDMK
jgi:hypothetical protein